MSGLLRYLFFLLIVRPVVLIVLGIHARHRDRLPDKGPAILVANHNSHLDTMVLMTLFPMSRLKWLRPVAAQDYFMRNRLLAWFSTRIIGIIPLARKGSGESMDQRLAPIFEAIDQAQILVLYPEGSRGQPEQLASFKSGVAYIAQRRPEVPVVPIFMHGLGKALPKGESLLVPFFCDLFVGEPMRWNGSRQDFMTLLESKMESLATEGHFPRWD